MGYLNGKVKPYLRSATRQRNGMATADQQLQAAEEKLKKQLRQVRAARGQGMSERDRDAIRKREQRLASRLIHIPVLSVEDRTERLRRENAPPRPNRRIAPRPSARRVTLANGWAGRRKAVRGQGMPPTKRANQ